MFHVQINTLVKYRHLVNDIGNNLQVFYSNVAYLHFYIWFTMKMSTTATEEYTSVYVHVFTSVLRYIRSNYKLQFSNIDEYSNLLSNHTLFKNQFLCYITCI